MAAARAASTTTLVWGTIQVPIKMYVAAGPEGKLPAFDTAGPKGGRLRKVERVIEAEPVEVPDPLAQELGLTDTVPNDMIETLTETQVVVCEPHSMAGYLDATADAAVVADIFAPTPQTRTVTVEGNDDDGPEITPEMVRRGVWLADDRFVDCTEQLERIEAATDLEVMEVIGSIDGRLVPRTRVTGAYYVGTGGSTAGPKVLALLHAGMRESSRALIVKWTKRTRQASGVLVATGRGDHAAVVLLELAWFEDMRAVPEQARITGVEISDGERAAATELVRAMGERVTALNELRDEARDLRERLVEIAQTGKLKDFDDVLPPEGPAQPVADGLLEALLATAAAR